MKRKRRRPGPCRMVVWTEKEQRQFRADLVALSQSVDSLTSALEDLWARVDALPLMFYSGSDSGVSITETPIDQVLDEGGGQ